MIQDIAPHIYHNEMSWQAPAPDDCVLLFSEKGEVCAGCTDGHLALPTVRLTGAELQQLQYLFSIDGRAYYLCTESRPLPGVDWQYFSTGALRRCIADDTLFACAAAGSLYRWYRNTRFCGCCGARLQKSETERAMVCPECGNVIYPKICPAVQMTIVWVVICFLLPKRSRELP